MDKNDVLKILDQEIGLIESKNTKSGLTIWVILTAIAGVIWLLLSSIQTESFDFMKALSYFLFLILLWDFYKFFVLELLDFDIEKPNLIRFYNTSDVVNSRQLYFAELIKFILVIVLLLYVTLEISPILKILLLTLYVLTSIGLFFAFTTSFFPILQYNDKNIKFSSKAKYIFILLKVLFSVFYLCFFYMFIITLKEEYYDFGNLKPAVLLFSLLYLIIVHIRLFVRDNPVLLQMIEIRRSLNFGYINFNEAFEKVDILIYGMKVEHFFQPRINKIVNLLSAGDELTNSAKKILQAADYKVNSEKIYEVYAFLEKIEKIVDEIKSETSKLNFSHYMIWKSNPEAESEINLVREKITRSSKKMSENFNQLAEMYKEIANKIAVV